MTTPATPAAPAAPPPPATPAAPATPPPAAASLADSIAPPAAAPPATPPATPPPAAAAPPATPPAAPPAAPAATPWFLAENVPGTGAPPDWFNHEKYKTVEEQAKAQRELEKRMGAFTGAPKEAYAINIPAQHKDAVQFDTTDPLFVKLGEWARTNQMSQKGFDGIIGMLAEYELAVAASNAPPTIEKTKADIGADADTRIASVANWAKANLDAAQNGVVREALKNPTEANVFKALEAVVAKTRQAALPKPGDGAPPPAASELEEINRLQAYVDPKTNRRPYVDDSKYREDVEKRRREYYAKQQQAA